MTVAADAVRARPRRRPLPITAPTIAAAGLLLILLALTAYPVLLLVQASLVDPKQGVFTLSGYSALLRLDGRVLTDTLGVVLVKTTLATAIAVGLAWIVVRTNTPGRRLFELLIILPFFLPPLVTAMAWLMLGAPRVGLINVAWRSLTGSQEPLVNMYSYGGLVWHMLQYSVPFIFLLVSSAFRRVDSTLEEAGRVSGASAWATTRTVTLPLLLPVISTAFILSLIRGLESFETPLIFGTPAGIKLVTTAIYDALYANITPDTLYASAAGVSLMLLMFVLIGWQFRMLRQRSFVSVTGRGFSTRTRELGRARWLTFAILLAWVCICVLLPVAELIYGSLTPVFGLYGNNLTLSHYSAILSDDAFWGTLRNTLLLAVGTATVTMALALAISYVVLRTRSALRVPIDLLAWLPWLMPGIVIGLGLLWAYVRIPPAISPYGTLAALGLAYLVLGIPLGTRALHGAISQISQELEHAARVHGASPGRATLTIILPLIMPAFFVGWMLTFFLAVREVSASILLYGPDTKVLSIYMVEQWRNGRIEEVAVVSLLMLLLVIVIRAVEWRQSRHADISLL